LKDTVNSLIAAGKRNFAIDLSPLDYIYSDAINVILAINRRILDVSGRLSLMSPNQEVKSILERAGLHNILKIYENETSLLKSSEDIILQTTRFNLSDLKNYQEPKPKSEFEDFRSEISTAMDPQKPEQFNSFESEIPEDNFTAQQPRKQQPQQSMEEQFIPPAPPPTTPRQQAHPFEGPSSGQRRTETNIPHKQPPRPAPAQETFKSEEMDTFETQNPVREATVRPKQQRSVKMSEREFDRMNEDEEDYEEEKPKNTLVPIIIGVIILCVLGIGGFIGFSIITKKDTKETKVATVQQQAPNAIPELAQPVEQAQPAPQPAAQPAVSSPAANNKTQEQAAPPETQPVEKKTSARQVAAQPKQTESAKKTTAKISINSKPSGATVTADGKEIGTTPCKYMDPPLGTINLVLSKQGYSDATKTIDYAGGNITQHISLTRLPKENQASVKSESSNSADVNATPPPSRVAAEPPPRPEPAAASSSGGDAATIFISSMPPVADVYMDGKLIGKTNISKLNVTTGSHSMKFVKGSVEVTEDLTFKPGDNPSHLVIMKK
jgi:anti-anti-sigma factor